MTLLSEERRTTGAVACRASPTTYTLTNVRVEFYDLESQSPFSGCSYAPARIVPLPSQTRTLATGERFTIAFEL
jgi:hypothetical protein